MNKEEILELLNNDITYLSEKEYNKIYYKEYISKRNISGLIILLWIILLTIWNIYNIFFLNVIWIILIIKWYSVFGEITWFKDWFLKWYTQINNKPKNNLCKHLKA